MDVYGRWHRVENKEEAIKKAKENELEETSFIQNGSIVIADAKHISEVVTHFPMFIDDIESYLEEESGIIFEDDLLDEEKLNVALRDTLISYLKSNHPDRWVPVNIREIKV
jgi:hypothetical protein